jgi:hypothetical protein
MTFIKLSNLLFRSGLVCVSLIHTAYGAEYWISKQGSDSNNCTSEASSCATIQKGISLAMPGDTVNIKSGIYIEDSSKSPYTDKCTWMSGKPISSLCIVRDGTKANPIVIQAAPGHERKVILENQSVRMGIHTANYDYIQIKGFTIRNNVVTGIASWGQTENAVADPARLGVGVLIENNAIFNTKGPWGVNTSAIHVWGTKDWIVRNNRIDDVDEADDNSARDGHGIQAYGVINALLENNHITNAGSCVYWKDHYVLNEVSRGFVVESEMRYNLFDCQTVGVLISIRGTDSPEAGINYIHHNIIRGMQNDGNGIRVGMSGAYGISGPIRIENNLIDGGGKTRVTGVSIDSATEARMVGNIFLRTSDELELVTYSKTKKPLLVSSNYNVFDGSFEAIVDRYGDYPTVQVRNFEQWKSMRSGDAVSLGVDFPDSKSKIYQARDVVQNIDVGNYKYTANFAADKFMPNGTNAGPYQYGNEVIGLTDASAVATSSVPDSTSSKPVSPEAKLIIN